jgi:hypothetical protein
VAFFLGPKVDASFYSSRKKEKGKIIYTEDWGLYKNGKGIFPAPLAKSFYPLERLLEPEVTEMEQVLLRDDLFPDNDKYPIFGAIFRQKEMRFVLRDLPIKRYFDVPRSDWKPEPGKVHELLTLPNETAAKTYAKEVLTLIDEKLRPVMNAAEFKSVRVGLDRHARRLMEIVRPASERKSPYIAQAIDAMLQDRGKPKERDEYPDLTEFWRNADPKVSALRADLLRLKSATRFGAPLVVARDFGKGRVVAVMTTAGKEWNHWGGGSTGAFIYQPFIWEVLNYLTRKPPRSDSDQ